MDEIEDQKKAFQESDRKYTRLIENAKYIDAEQNRILAISEENIKKLNEYEKLISQV